jgi:hypothetical protein
VEGWEQNFSSMGGDVAKVFYGRSKAQLLATHDKQPTHDLGWKIQGSFSTNEEQGMARHFCEWVHSHLGYPKKHKAP